MTRRKPHNMRARLERAAGALLRQHHACIVDASVPEVQVMLNYKNLRQILTAQVASALCDLPHHWTVYISAICQSGNERWAKSIEYELAGIHVITKLPDLFEQPVQNIIATCNPAHVIGHAWIAVPDSIDLDARHAHRIYERVGAWNQVQQVSA